MQILYATSLFSVLHSVYMECHRGLSCVEQLCQFLAGNHPGSGGHPMLDGMTKGFFVGCGLPAGF